MPWYVIARCFVINMIIIWQSYYEILLHDNFCVKDKNKYKYYKGLQCQILLTGPLFQPVASSLYIIDLPYTEQVTPKIWSRFQDIFLKPPPVQI